jgi:uncharacterized protein with GYD domain
VLIQFSAKTTKVLYAGQVEEKEAFTYKVKVMGRHGETSQFAFSDKDNMGEIEREENVAKLPRAISSGGTARTTTLKHCSVNFLKELCRQRNSVLLWTLSSFTFIYYQ